MSNWFIEWNFDIDKLFFIVLGSQQMLFMDDHVHPHEKNIMQQLECQIHLCEYFWQIYCFRTITCFAP